MNKPIQFHHWQFPILFLTVSAVWLHLVGLANPGHMDEYDYLFVGKNLIEGKDWPSLTYIFGAEFNWFLYGLAERTFGGLNGARLLATLCGVISLIAAYYVTKNVWRSRLVALYASLLLAIAAPHVFVSHMATYDILSFTLFVSSLYPLLVCCQDGCKKPYYYMVVGVCLFAAAILSKYIILIYVPLIGVLMLYFATRIALLAGILLAAILGFYLFYHFDDLSVLYNNQIVGVHGSNTTRAEITRLLLPYLLIPLLLWLIGIYAICKDPLVESTKYFKLFIMSLLLASPMLGYHIYSENMISQYKHVVYSLFFLAPTSAWVLVKLFCGVHASKGKTFASMLLIAPIVVSSSTQINAMQSGYPDSQQMLTKVLPFVKSDTKILSEDPYLFRYKLYNDIPQSQIRESGWLDYNRDGVYEAADVRLALTDRFYDIVLINDQIHPLENARYRNILSEQGYKLIYAAPYSLSSVMTRNQSGIVSLFYREAVSDSVIRSSFDER